MLRKLPKMAKRDKIRNVKISLPNEDENMLIGLKMMLWTKNKHESKMLVQNATHTPLFTKTHPDKIKMKIFFVNFFKYDKNRR